jgi:Ribonuclease G/E
MIARIEPSLQAAFVDYGVDRNGFLQKQDIHYDYFHEDDNGDDPAPAREARPGGHVQIERIRSAPRAPC